VLALRGHEVTVLERASEPGGQVLLARLVPGRADLAARATYLAGAATRAGAVIHLGVQATVAAIVAWEPDTGACPTGARPGIPAVPGIEPRPAGQLALRVFPDFPGDAPAGIIPAEFLPAAA